MIEPFTTRATFRVNQEGAQIYHVDDELVGTSPLAAPVVLDIGERRLRATKGGFTTFEKSFVVAGGPELTIDVALEKEIHEGKLVVEAPAGAVIFVDDKEVPGRRAGGAEGTERRPPVARHWRPVVGAPIRPR